MDLVVNEELKAYIDPLTADEHDALERSILAEGCRDALVLWGDMLVDGHNRYGICRQHGLPFQTVQSTRFQSLEDVHLWMIDQHLGRRSLSDYQRGVLALRKREIVSGQRARRAAEPAETASPAPVAAAPALDTREALATYDGYARDNVAWGGAWDVDPTRLTVPTWLWYGDADRMVPPSQGRWLAQRIPQATLIVRPGEGHGRTIFAHWDEMFSALGAGPPTP
jgi:pimeloyl-ACP methyl ester carboxylesterase